MTRGLGRTEQTDTTVLLDARVVTGRGVVDGWIELTRGRVRAVGAGTYPNASTTGVELVDLDGQWVAPGFVDIHVHGGGGASFQTGDPSETARGVTFHRAHGTTTLLASLVTAAVPELVAATVALADLIDSGVPGLAGIHLEGPFLASARCGAHDPRLLRTPDADVVETLLRAGRGHIRMVTLAPELPGGIDAVRQVVAAGAVAAVGHTDATYEQTLAAIDAGATVATHLFNGMAPLHHRRPGPVPALMVDPRVVLELVDDRLHLHDAVVAGVFRSVGPARVALVTDAIAAAGLGDGDYLVGGQHVVVTGGSPALAAGGSLAGSTLTMAQAVRHAVGQGVSIADALTAAATTPAQAVGLGAGNQQGRPGVGVLAPGSRADLVVLDEGLALRRVMVAGRWEDLA